MSSKTIVTACDRNFIWGTVLLIASLRRHGVQVPVHVLTHGLAPAERAMLGQMGNVRLFETAAGAEQRHMVYQKTAALMTADTDLVMWVDSDCIVTGNISEMIDTTGEGLQIRLRPPDEICYLFRRRYAPGEPRGDLPRKVVDVWRDDVGQRSEPRIHTSCNAHCFVVHRSRFDFILRWNRQIEKVIPEGTANIVNDRSFAYFLLDEAVLSSLLAFADEVPLLSDYCLEDKVIHFGGRPKPWERWLLRNMACFDEVIDTIEWAAAQGWELPAVNWHLTRSGRPLCALQALFFELFRRTRLLAAQCKPRNYT